MRRLFLLVSLLLYASVLSAENWPQLRGPDRQGRARGPAPTSWSETENVLWKRAIPGKGWSSPVVWGNRIWITTALSADSTSKVSPSKQVPTVKAGELSLRAVSVDRTTGRIIDNIELFTPSEIDSIHSLNTYASPTPVIEAGRLYCHFGAYGNACVDTTTGEVLWRRVIKVDHSVGPGSSTVLYKNLLILTYDGIDRQFITALDKSTGEPVWRTNRPPVRAGNPEQHKAYSTPLIVPVGGTDQLMGPTAQWFVAYDPLTGSELWRMEHGAGFSVVPSPVATEGVVYFSSGYLAPEMISVRTDGSGDVTNTHVLGRIKRQAPTQSSPLLVGQRIYTVSEAGVGVCLNDSLSKVLWQKRLGGNYSASPLLAGGKVYFFSREGVGTVVDNGEQGPTIESRNQLDGMIMATPAIVDGQLFIRTAEHLYCIGET